MIGPLGSYDLKMYLSPFGGTDEILDLKSTGKEIESCIQLKRDKLHSASGGIIPESGLAQTESKE